MKKCTICLERKPLKEFHMDRAHKDNKRSACKKCCSIQMKIHNSKPKVKEHTRKRQKIYHALPKTKILKQEYSLHVRYGLTIKDKEQMLESQGGRCQICRDRLPIRQAYVDHDHETDVIRGILCNHCNRGLGGFRDNPETMESAAEYIRKAKAPDFYA